jgi:hypothetical protein
VGLLRFSTAPLSLFLPISCYFGKHTLHHKRRTNHAFLPIVTESERLKYQKEKIKHIFNNLKASTQNILAFKEVFKTLSVTICY